MFKMMRSLAFLFAVASSAVMNDSGVMAFSSSCWSNHNKQRTVPSRKSDSTRNSRQTNSLIVLPSLLGSSSSRSRTSSTAVTRSTSTTALGMGLTLYGHPGTRSPLVNWGAYEVDLSIEMANDLSQNPHPFRQLPCLVDDDNDAVLFESGAILLYLHELTKSVQQLTPSQSASVLSWITWANASLDPICFLETPEGKVYDTGLKKPNKKMSRLNDLLSTQPFLVGDKFTLADVAVASYLLYVVQFFPDINIIDKWPHVHRYMKECVSRAAYAQAFGSNVQNFLIQQLEQQQQTPAANKKGIFGGLL